MLLDLFNWLLMAALMVVALAIPVLLVVGALRWLLGIAPPEEEMEPDDEGHEVPALLEGPAGEVHVEPANPVQDAQAGDLRAEYGQEGEPQEPEGAVEEEPEGEEAPDDAPPPNVRLPGPEERMVQVFSTPSRTQADLLRAVLLDHGIWCFLSGDYNALGTLGLAEVTLHVPTGDVPLARQIIDEMRGEAHANQIAEGRLKCPACGYDLRATPKQCPECGLRVSTMP